MPTAERAKEIIAKIPYVTIATVAKDSKPWNAPVFAAYDTDYNFYWGTYRNSQKSKNIRANENIFIVIYDSTAPAGKGEGVYIEAVAAELKNAEEIRMAHKLLRDRHIVPYWKLEQVQGAGPIRLYRAESKKVWMNGERREKGNYIDTRVEIIL